MATSNPSIDSLSSEERLIIGIALSGAAASLKRSIKSAVTPDVAAAFNSQLVKVESLIIRFR